MAGGLTLNGLTRLNESVGLLLFTGFVSLSFRNVVPLTEIIQDEIHLFVHETTRTVTRLVLLVEVALGAAIPIIYRGGYQCCRGVFAC